MTNKEKTIHLADVIERKVENLPDMEELLLLKGGAFAKIAVIHDNGKGITERFWLKDTKYIGNSTYRGVVDNTLLDNIIPTGNTVDFKFNNVYRVYTEEEMKKEVE